MEPTTADLFEARMKRITDAVEGKVPDRVPTLVDFGYYAAKYGGITVKDAFYDPKKWADAWKKTVLGFQPDLFFGLMFFPGAAYDAVDTNVYKWPGHGLGDNQSFQAIELETMKADEYDDLLDDPSDFIIRKMLPRAANNLAGFQMLPPLSIFSNFASGFIPVPIMPGVVTACEALYKAAQICQEWFYGARLAMLKELEDEGFPAVYQAAPISSSFETIGIYLRGMKGSMLDMYRQPDKLLAALNRLHKISLKMARMLTPMGRNTICFCAALRGADGFMSKDQFEKFYWPSLKESINVAINNGWTPAMLWEGDFTSRLEYLAELPEGKIIHRFDKTDPIKAREVLGPRHCISGGISGSLLNTGTPDDVKERCKKLIDKVGKDGAYIMGHSCQMDDMKPENMKAMIDFTAEYGVYR